MGIRRYPPLTPSDVRSILLKLGFKMKRQEGSHAHYERLPDEVVKQRRIVTVDTAHAQFSRRLIKSMIEQSGFTRREFYAATKRTAKKI